MDKILEHQLKAYVMTVTRRAYARGYGDGTSQRLDVGATYSHWWTSMDATSSLDDHQDLRSWSEQDPEEEEATVALPGKKELLQRRHSMPDLLPSKEIIDQDETLNPIELEFTKAFEAQKWTIQEQRKDIETLERQNASLTESKQKLIEMDVKYHRATLEIRALEKLVQRYQEELMHTVSNPSKPILSEQDQEDEPPTTTTTNNLQVHIPPHKFFPYEQDRVYQEFRDQWKGSVSRSSIQSPTA